MVENQKERKNKILRSDRGGEYFSREFSIFCEEKKFIKWQHPIHYNIMDLLKGKIRS